MSDQAFLAALRDRYADTTTEALAKTYVDIVASAHDPDALTQVDEFHLVAEIVRRSYADTGPAPAPAPTCTTAAPPWAALATPLWVVAATLVAILVTLAGAWTLVIGLVAVALVVRVIVALVHRLHRLWAYGYWCDLPNPGVERNNTP